MDHKVRVIRVTFFPIHSMLGDVVSIPVNPPKVHSGLLPTIVAGERLSGTLLAAHPRMLDLDSKVETSLLS